MWVYLYLYMCIYMCIYIAKIYTHMYFHMSKANVFWLGEEWKSIFLGSLAGRTGIDPESLVNLIQTTMQSCKYKDEWKRHPVHICTALCSSLFKLSHQIWGIKKWDLSYNCYFCLCTQNPGHVCIQMEEIIKH